MLSPVTSFPDLKDTPMAYELTQNSAAFFIRYASGKTEAFATETARAAVVAEIDADNAAWFAA